MTVQITRLDGVTVGPDQILVLRSKTPLSSPDLDRINRYMPAELKGRVVIVDSGMEVFVIDQGEVGILSCGCVPPCEGHEREDES